VTDKSNTIVLVVAGVIGVVVLLAGIYLLRKPAPKQSDDLSWGELGELGVTIAKIYYGAA
jgi:hypothetical protein